MTLRRTTLLPTLCLVIIVGVLTYQQLKISSLTAFNHTLALRNASIGANDATLVLHYEELLSYARAVEGQRNRLAIKVRALEAVYGSSVVSPTSLSSTQRP